MLGLAGSGEIPLTDDAVECSSHEMLFVVAQLHPGDSPAANEGRQERSAGFQIPDSHTLVEATRHHLVAGFGKRKGRNALFMTEITRQSTSRLQTPDPDSTISATCTNQISIRTQREVKYRAARLKRKLLGLGLAIPRPNRAIVTAGKRSRWRERSQRNSQDLRAQGFPVVVAFRETKMDSSVRARGREERSVGVKR